MDLDKEMIRRDRVILIRNNWNELPITIRTKDASTLSGYHDDDIDKNEAQVILRTLFPDIMEHKKLIIEASKLIKKLVLEIPKDEKDAKTKDVKIWLNRTKDIRIG